MRKLSCLLAGLVLTLPLVCLSDRAAAADPADESPGDDAIAVRVFRFNYGATLKDLSAGSDVRVWLPVPPSNQEQLAEIADQDLPAEAELGIEPKHGNRMMHFQATVPDSGSLAFRVSYHIERSEVRVTDPAASSEALSPEERKALLQPDALVPIEGKPLTLIEEVNLADEPLPLARQLYDRVYDHMAYSKEGTGWGQGDVLWACDSRYGNCTDFHSLFISLARSQGLPARFEMGFSLPPERGEGKIAGYHCWAWFYADGQGWVPVDISEADKHPEMVDYYFGSLTADRAVFSSGRDLVLEPPQQGPRLNFFIYPYAEVDGQPVAKAKLELNFSFQDL